MISMLVNAPVCLIDEWSLIDLQVQWKIGCALKLLWTHDAWLIPPSQGLITGRTTAFLLDPKRADMRAMKQIVATQSHEVAHMYLLHSTSVISRGSSVKIGGSATSQQ